MILRPCSLAIASLALLAGCGGSSASSRGAASVAASTSAAPSSVTSGSTGSTASGLVSGTSSTGPDRDAPVIALVSPTRGAFLAGQQHVGVEGTVQDASQVAYLLLNGLPVTLDAGNSFLEVLTLTPGLNVITLEAADTWGNRTRTALSVLAGDFLPTAQPVGDAVVARLNRPAFDAVEQVAAQQLGGPPLANMILQQNPLYTGSGGLATLQVDATSASFGTPRLELDPRAGALGVRAELPSVDVTVRAHGDVLGIGYSLTTRVTATLAVLDAEAVVNVAQGQLSTQLHNVVVDLQGFNFDINNVPGFLEALARDAVRRVVEREVQRQVEQVVPQEVNRALAGANAPITRTVLGRPVTLHLVPTAVSFDPDGASVRTDGDLVVTPPAGYTPLPAPGSLVTAGAAPTHPLTQAFHVSANDDLLNRVGHAAWQGGLLHLRIDQALVAQQTSLPPWLQLDAFLLTTFFPSLAPHLNAADPIELEVSALTPPVFATRPAPGLLEGGLGELSLAVYVAPAGRPRELVLEASLQVEAAMSARVTPAGAIEVLVDGRPVAITDVHTTPIAPLDETAVENLVDFVLPPALQLVARSLSGFPLPVLPGFTPSNLTIESDGPQGDFLTVRGDL